MVIDILFLLTGAYLLINTFIMKKKGTIPAPLVSKKVNLEKARDVDGYIKAIFLPNVLFGASLVLISLVSIFVGYYAIPSWVSIALFTCNFVSLILYSVFSVKIQNKYLF